MKSPEATKNFGKRRVTRLHSWLSCRCKDWARSFSGLMRYGKVIVGWHRLCSDQDPDSRLCGRLRTGDTRRKNVFFLKFFDARLRQKRSRQHEWTLRSIPEEGFLRDRRALKYASPTKAKGKGFNQKRAFPLLETNISSPSCRLSLGRLLLSRACLCFTGQKNMKRRFTTRNSVATATQTYEAKGKRIKTQQR